MKKVLWRLWIVFGLFCATLYLATLAHRAGMFPFDPLGPLVLFRATAPAPEVLQTTAQEMVDAYLANDARGDLLFKGKTVQFVTHGWVQSKHVGGGYRVARHLVECYFPESERASLASLPGPPDYQGFLVRGVCRGLVDGRVLVVDCERLRGRWKVKYDQKTAQYTYVAEK